MAEDIIGFRDQLGARLAAVIRPKGHKHQPNEVALPDGISPPTSLPPHIDRPWKRFEAAVNELAGSQARVRFLLRQYVEMIDDPTQSRRLARSRKAEATSSAASSAGTPATG